MTKDFSAVQKNVLQAIDAMTINYEASLFIVIVSIQEICLSLSIYLFLFSFMVYFIWVFAWGDCQLNRLLFFISFWFSGSVAFNAHLYSRCNDEVQ